MGRQGVRAEWSEIPESVRSGIETVAGASVVGATNLDGGFSPGPAARCDLSDGRTVFVKAAGAELNAFTPDMHRREADVLVALPAGVPAPTLLGVVDDGDWVALIVEWIDGAIPIAPLESRTIERVLRLTERLADAGSDCNGASFEHCAVLNADLAGHWRELAAGPLDGLDARLRDNIDELVRLEADFGTAVVGTSLLHGDLRTDNMVFAADESDDVVVDWPSACLGAPWFDLVTLLPSLHLDGGPAPRDVFATTALGRAADGDAVDVVLTAITGYFIGRSLQPPPPGLPTVRHFQAAQGAVALDWLAHRRGWKP